MKNFIRSHLYNALMTIVLIIPFILVISIADANYFTIEESPQLLTPQDYNEYCNHPLDKRCKLKRYFH